MNNIRNFCIISHIDHGKSTLADRFLELTQTVEKRKMRQQYLDQMDLERERGITIKLQPVRMVYRLPTTDYGKKESAVSGSPLAVVNSEYILNLIDTPGHVDFTYEVSRSLQAVEGAILLVDATKGIQAQTLANLHLALEQNLVIIPVINKIDSSAARVEEVEKEILELRDALGANVKNFSEYIYKISAKEGTGVEKLLQAVIEKVPSPKGEIKDPLRALVFDSVYDSYKGVLAYIRVVDGQIRKGENILLVASGAKSEVIEAGIFKPNLISAEKLSAGEIGYLATGLKNVGQCRVGDTLTIPSHKARILPGYKEPKPMIFASFYPANDKDFDILKDALGKLKLSDAALVFEPESSALGRGYKCGFLGMLHLEIISERLKREYRLNLVITTPSLTYKLVEKHTNEEETIYSAHQMPESHLIEEIQERWARLEIISPAQYLGKVMELLGTLEGVYKDTKYLTTERLIVEHEVPLREIIVDFYDKLKSVSSGYASMSYELLDWRRGDLARMDILVAGEKVDAFSRIVSRQRAQQEGRALVEKLKEAIPPQLFAVSLQAAIGGSPRSGGAGKIIARENIRAMRKDVTGYLYGGDVTRKKKLLEKQKKGKKKMKAMGKVNIPQDVYINVLRK